MKYCWMPLAFLPWPLLPPAQAAGDDIPRLIEMHGWFLALLTLFVLGLALNLTPCVYPLVPITVGYFSKQGEGKAQRVLLLAVLYVLGIAVTYATLGVAAALTGRLFGEQMQRLWVVGGIAVLVVILALGMFGVYQLRVPGFLLDRLGGSATAGALGALLMGLLVGLVAAPCIGPVTLSLLLY